MTPDPVADLVIAEAGTLDFPVLVVDDAGGALASSAMSAGGEVRAWCDDVRDERALPAGVVVLDHLDAETLKGVRTVLLRLPTSLAALEETSERIAAYAAADVRLVAGGRIKHMTRTQNEVLARRFADVSASLGARKSRVLRASGPLPGPLTWPRSGFVPSLELNVVAHGSVFATHRLDDGTRLLLENLRPGVTGRAVDLGCGSGIVASWLAREGFEVLGTDVSASAVASTLATAAANGVDVETMRTVGLGGVGQADLIVCNPPFHRGAAKDSTPAADMLGQAAAVLAAGGELWVVYNSHLPYLPLLRTIGPTDIVERNRAYTVTRTRCPATGSAD